MAQRNNREPVEDNPADLLPDMGQPGTGPQGQDTGDNDPPDLEGMEAGLKHKVLDFFEEYKREQKPLTAYLYKFIDKNSGSEKEHCDTWKDDLWDMDRIGKAYGGGRYMLIVYLAGPRNNRHPRSLTFRINDRYNILKAQMERDALNATFAGQPQPLQALQPQRADNSLAEAFKLVTGLMQTIIPMMKQSAPAPVAQSSNPLESFAMMQGIMKKQLMDNVSLYNDLTRKGFLKETPESIGDMEPETIEPPAPPREPTFIEQIIPLITQVLPMLTQNNAKANAAAAGLRMIPVVQQGIETMQQKPNEVKQLIEYFEKQPGMTKAKIDIALKKMGIKRPA